GDGRCDRRASSNAARRATRLLGSGTNRPLRSSLDCAATAGQASLKYPESLGLVKSLTGPLVVLHHDAVGAGHQLGDFLGCPVLFFEAGRDLRVRLRVGRLLLDLLVDAGDLRLLG